MSQKKLSTKAVERLLDVLLRNLYNQTPTPVLGDDGTIDRYNVTLFSKDYERLMLILELAGGFQPPEDDRMAIMTQFEAKAKTAGGSYDLGEWSMGELEAARDDTAGIPELAAFHEAIKTEARARVAS